MQTNRKNEKMMKKNIFFNNIYRKIFKNDLKNQKNVLENLCAKNTQNNFYMIKGSNNHIIVIKEGTEFELTDKIQGLDIYISGNNNTIRLEYPFNPLNSRILIQNDNVQIDIGSTSYFQNVEIDCFLGNGQKFKMGRNTCIVEAHCILEEEGSILIGEKCLFSSKILIRTSDGHSIISKDGKECLTETAGEIKIGNHVWIGIEVMFLKNSSVEDNCVIAARSIVNKKFYEKNVVLAGIPAKVIKSGINWRQENPWMIKNNKFYNNGL